MSSVKLVTPEDLAGLLDNPTDREKLAIIDCRDEDRAEGWIVSSIHMPSHTSSSPKAYQALAELLFDQGKLYAVFHCHSSLTRGPQGARRFAAAQRETGCALPAVCVLRGGWEAFRMVYGHCRSDILVIAPSSMSAGMEEEAQKRTRLEERTTASKRHGHPPILNTAGSKL